MLLPLVVLVAIVANLIANLSINGDHLLTAIVSILTSIGVLLTGIGTISNSRRITKVHDEVKTGNGNTLGALADISHDRDKEIDDASAHSNNTGNIS